MYECNPELNTKCMKTGCFTNGGECHQTRFEVYKINPVDFGTALEMLKKGAKAWRKGWNGKGIFIELQRPDAYSKMTSPYIFIDTTGLDSDNPDAPRSRVPWLASQTDLLAEDWEYIRP